MDEAAEEAVEVNGTITTEMRTRAKYRKDDRLTTVGVHTVNCSTLTRDQDPIPVNNVEVPQHHRLEVQRQQFEIHVDQTTAGEAVLDLPSEVPKRVEFISVLC